MDAQQPALTARLPLLDRSQSDAVPRATSHLAELARSSEAKTSAPFRLRLLLFMIRGQYSWLYTGTYSVLLGLVLTYVLLFPWLEVEESLFESAASPGLIVWTWLGVDSVCFVVIGGRIVQQWSIFYLIDVLLWSVSLGFWVVCIYAQQRELWDFLVPLVSIRVCGRYLLFGLHASFEDFYGLTEGQPHLTGSQILNAIRKVAGQRHKEWADKITAVLWQIIANKPGGEAHIERELTTPELVDFMNVVVHEAKVPVEFESRFSVFDHDHSIQEPAGEMENLASRLATHLRSLIHDDDEVKYGVWQVLESTWGHLSHQPGRMCLLCFYVMITSCMVPLQNVLIGKMVNHAADAYENSITGSSNEHQLIILRWYCVGLLGSWVVATVGCYLMSEASATIISKGTEALQQATVMRTARSSVAMADELGGSFNSVFSSSIQRVAGLWSSLLWCAVVPIISILLGLGTCLTQGRAGVKVCCAFVGVLGPILTVSYFNDRAAGCSADFSALNKQLSARYQHMTAILPAIRASKSFGFVASVIEPWIQRSKVAWRALLLSSSVVQLWFNQSSMLLELAIIAAVLYVSVTSGETNMGTFFTLSGLVKSMIKPVGTLGALARMILQGAGALQLVDQLVKFDSQSKEGEDEDAASALVLSNELQFKNVVFTYPAAEFPALDGLNLTIEAGSYTVICGGSGSGKSTLLSLLIQERLLARSDSGSIEVDGVVMQGGLLESFKDQVGVVFQSSTILYGLSICENITFGQSVNMAKVEQAAKAAQIHDTIQALANGYATELHSSGGISLSGGQLQRVCLARALYREPSLLLLDEATSALDPVTESEIIETLLELHRNSKQLTIVSVSHHPSTAKAADMVVVMDQGRIVEQGGYDELLSRSSGFFFDLVHSDSRFLEAGQETRIVQKGAY